MFAIFLDLAEKPEEIPPLKWEEDMQLFSQFIDRKVGSSMPVLFTFHTHVYN